MQVVREEIFGPVIVVVPFDGDDEGHRDRERQRLRPLRLRVQRRLGPCDAHRASGCAPATSASTPCSATTRRRSAARSTAASVATAARSASTPTASSRAWCGPGDGVVERDRRHDAGACVTVNVVPMGDGLRHAAAGAGAKSCASRWRGRTTRRPADLVRAAQGVRRRRASSTWRCATTSRCRRRAAHEMMSNAVVRPGRDAVVSRRGHHADAAHDERVRGRVPPADPDREALRARSTRCRAAA